MMFVTAIALLAACGSAAAQCPSPSPSPSASAPPGIIIPYTATDTCALSSAQATAVTSSSTSNVKGKAFDRYFQIMLETISYGNATADVNCQALIEQGLLLTSMYGVGAPSQPNYVAPGSGDTFGANSDSFFLVDQNISTIVDLLEDKGISWSDYNGGLPYTGFQGFKWENGLYERKHNLLARFDSIRLNPDRSSRLKNETYFWVDMENQQVPQWSFFTPNLYDDAHNTDVRTTCAWTRGFVEILLKSTYFMEGRTVIYVTWQANGNQAGLANHVAGIILGSGLPEELVGTTDDNFYNHYSELSTVEANWDLHTLGRWDVGANVWQFVADQTGDEVRQWDESIAGDSFENYLWNQSYGAFSRTRTTQPMSLLLQT